MDIQQILQLLNQTFEVGAQRTQAEITLSQLSKQHGFSSVLLQLVATTTLPQGIRQAGAIYFKNMVLRSWDTLDPLEGEAQRFKISDRDKSVARAHLTEAIVDSPPNVRRQLLTALSKIIMVDYPQNWPDLLPKLCMYLSVNELPVIFAGLQCLLEIARKYEYKNSKDLGSFEQVIISTFPILLQLVQQCINTPTIEAGDALKHICKIVHASIAFNLPKPLRNPALLTPWTQALLHVVSLPLPPDPVSRSPFERHKFSWWQAKKWACRILNDFFDRYGNVHAASHLKSKKERKRMEEFGKAYFEQVVPNILDTYLQQLEFTRQGNYMSPRVLHCILNFLVECVQYGSTWKRLKPYVMIVVREIVFPLLCFSDQDQEKWDEDPTDFIRSQFDIDEDFKSPVLSGKNLVHKLVTTREQILRPILQFANEVLHRYENTPVQQRNYREKDGVLNLLGSLSSILIGFKDMALELQQLMLVHILPEVSSPLAFLRARASWAVGCLAEADYPDPNVALQMLQTVLPRLQEEELPVVVHAALALNSLVDRKELEDALRPMVPQIMSVLLRLNTEHELDEFSYVIDKMIEIYADQMVPFAEPICSQLCDSFMRIITDTEAEGVADDSEESSARSITAMVTLRSVLTLIRSMDESPQVLSALERILYPLIEYILNGPILDFLDEIYEMVAAFTYASKDISPLMWQVFFLMYKAFKNGAFDYFKEMLPALDNFVSSNSAVFLSVPDRLQALVDMISTVLSSQHTGEEDQASACMMMEVVFLSCREQVDFLLEPFIRAAMTALEEAEIRSLTVASLKVVINAIYYNPLLALNTLSSTGLLERFFVQWNKNVSVLTRVHDKKLSILTLSALYSLPPEAFPPVVHGGLHLTMNMLLELFKTLPDAYKARKAWEDYMQNGVDEEDEDDDEEEAEANEEGPSGDQDPDGDTVDVKDQQYMRMLAKKAAKLSPLKKFQKEEPEEDEEEEGDDDDGEYEEDEDEEAVDERELEEELSYHTPIDDIDEYLIFAQVFQNIQQQNAYMFNRLTQHLTPQQQAILQQVLKTANEHLQQQQQQQQ